jgi:hypothetical protein
MTPTQPATDPISTAIANVTAAEAVFTADAPTLSTIQSAVTAGAGPLPLQQVAQVLTDIQTYITSLQQLIQTAAGQIQALVQVQEALTAVQAFPSLGTAITQAQATLSAAASQKPA